MKDDRHERIQRCLDGKAPSEESAALHEAMKEDAELRALYLDYANLEVALGVAAAKQSAATRGGRAREELRSRIWLAAAAALMLILWLVSRPRSQESDVTQSEIAASLRSTQAAIARMSVETTPPSTWRSSPTDSLLLTNQNAPTGSRTP